MPNKPASAPYQASRLAATVLVAGLLSVSGLAQESVATGPENAPPDQTADESPGEPQPKPDDSNPESIEGADREARPSLDYEPSEAISEDRSVSFPVDI